MHFVGIHWGDTSKKPYMLFRREPDSGKVIAIELKSEDSFNIEINQLRYCPGYMNYDKKSKSPCSNKRLMSEEEGQCSSCRAKEALHYLSFRGLNAEQVCKLQSYPHMNYINIFGRDLIKTGVSATWRKTTRLLEQGAIATIYFAATDGYTSRKIEENITKVLGIKQAWNWDIKLSHIAETITESESKAKLINICNQIKENINEDFISCLFQEPQFSYNKSFYQLKIDNNGDEIYFINSISPKDKISGVIKGIYGEILLLENDKTLYGVNLRQLLGYVIKQKETKTTEPIELKIKPKALKFNTYKMDISLFEI